MYMQVATARGCTCWYGYALLVYPAVRTLGTRWDRRDRRSWPHVAAGRPGARGKGVPWGKGWPASSWPPRAAQGQCVQVAATPMCRCTAL